MHRADASSRPTPSGSRLPPSSPPPLPSRATPRMASSTELAVMMENFSWKKMVMMSMTISGYRNCRVAVTPPDR